MNKYRKENEICVKCGSGTHDYGGSWSCNDFNCDCNSETRTSGIKTIPEWWNNGIKVYKDGDMWCAVKSGFINLAESPAGFGNTPHNAVVELNKLFF